MGGERKAYWVLEDFVFYRSGNVVLQVDCGGIGKDAVLEIPTVSRDGNKIDETIYVQETVKFIILSYFAEIN
ncbi:hypothetical protein SS50377_24143 [Spironucleus salmonicida]|uniref:Uncharacterized protein n=1 Tax=Spironucleus salmonicida TaxID=348837 RepID=A0A9P8LTX9_9EUKA|nr:hypothetical protein SS50377_24143 [Spironucleus salmonicida]